MSSYSTYNDSQLILLLKDNDETAYTELFDRYQPLLFIYACKITKDETEASDIVQEVFLNLWEKRFEIELTGTILSYLYQSVRFKFFNLLDKKKVRKDYADSLSNFINDGSFVTDNDIREREMMQLLEKQIELLPSALKLTYCLSRNQNMTNTEIANHLNISEKTVSNRLSLATHLLKVKIGLSNIGLLVAGTEVLKEILKKF